MSKMGSQNDGPQILTFALQKRPRATRASVPKVRTGCVTCKKRHVKCDEARPSCQRCIKWRGFCGGYDPSSSVSVSPSPADTSDAVNNPRKRTKRRAQKLQSSTRKEPQVDARLLIEPDELELGDEIEKEYFLAWISSRSDFGGGLFEDVLWEQTIPQLSRGHPAIRHALAAIGAMMKARSPGFIPATAEELAASGPDYGHALSYYGQAIGSIRGVDMDVEGLRTAIICSLLFNCFEILHGDCKAGFSHFINAQNIMDHALSKFDAGNVEGNPFGAESVENDILQMLQRLSHQAWSYGVLRPCATNDATTEDLDPQLRSARRSWCCRRGSKDQNAVDKMPSNFSTVGEARRWWEVVQHHVIHFSNMAFRMSHTGLSEEYVAVCNHRVLEHLQITESMAMSGFYQSSASWRHFHDCLSRWKEAFRPLWETAQANKARDMDMFVRSAHLRAQYLNLYACLRAPLSCDYASVLQLTPVFREIVDLSGTVLQRQREKWGGNEVFTMDTGLLHAVFLTSMLSRNFEVREQAIKVLSDNPRRDGIWDSRLFHALATRNQVLEMSNSREGTAEEQWQRLKSRASFLDSIGPIKASAIAPNPLSEKWEKVVDNVGNFFYLDD